MARTALATKALDEAAPSAPPFIGSLFLGGIIGLVSGVTGVGGGIFLAPLVLWLGWAARRRTAAISVVFNLLDSAAPLAGTWATLPLLPAIAPLVGLRGCRWPSRLMGRGAAPRPPNAAITAIFPPACGGGENDHCLALGRHNRIRDGARVVLLRSFWSARETAAHLVERLRCTVRP
jgi:hypothetical protein